MSKTRATQICKILALPIWVVASYFLAQIIAIAFIYCLAFIFHFDILSTTGSIFCQILLDLIFIFLVVFIPKIFFKSLKTSRTELGLHKYLTWSDIGLSVAGLIVYFICATALTYVFSFLPFFNATQAQDIGVSTLSGTGDRFLMFTVTVILVPIIEEIIFRGWLYGKLRARITGKASLLLSIFIVSLIFGFLHGQWNVGVDVFAMSVIMCLMRETTGTIYSGILLHILKNAIAFYIMFIMV